MSKRREYTWWADKCIILLIVFSMLAIVDIEIAGFPLYVLLLLIVTAGWMTIRMRFHAGNENFLKPRSLTDIAAVIAIGIGMFSVIYKLFQNPDKTTVDFSINAEIIAFALLYFLLSSGIQMKLLYIDFILYGGLLASTVFMLPFFMEEQMDFFTKTLFQDAGAASSYFLLLSMFGVYRYCTCKDRLRSCFYLSVSGVAFFSLFLNHNVISFWLMSIYFIAMPVILRPTALLVKKDMQMFFFFVLMLSNMSLLTGYTKVIVKELSYSLEHSVYLDLLLAIGALFFFHYWDQIPEEIDLERLVMRKMRRGYQLLLKITGILFIGIVLGFDKWNKLGDGVFDTAFTGFAVPLSDSARQTESAFYVCFRDIGIIVSIFIIIFSILLADRMYRKFSFDRPVTGNMILISSIFMIQLFFWKPAVNTLAVYLILFFGAAFNIEEKVKVTSIKIRKEELWQRDAPSAIFNKNKPEKGHGYKDEKANN